ncbi:MULTISPECIES: Gfo/Idh/MocA family protein [unclassified Bradyrhizobium]|uniref:Gfo/Idh/MocA family protein n=1 Tax=unclassified Bradyrhizobium TaxID=2631580 RepID=UPI0020B259BD|nr:MULTISPECIES: Gfo/Idh/MocA family oxidoreductase [unclassified Bradyrhizobium]MCP3380080.1 Gfo/Idh/MocA family oxidoreductase [Bradyrhizobium sp. CCGUVB4N]MCP3440925.1 Gfo/Idh/MocA family oxidoreductase [Bradyrhizobium sp. CCGUVB14]
MMIKYAVVGAGAISQQAFLPGVGQSANSKVTAIVTGHRDKAAQLADFHGIGQVANYDGYDALLRGSDVDVVYIALPNHLHADYTVRAARAGKHILVEKPLATNEQDALAMIAAAREAGVFLMTAYRLHNEPGTVAVLEHVRNNAIGRPLFFQSVFSFQTAIGNHRLKAASWGGPLQDVGVYCVNAARHIFTEEPIEAVAMAHRPIDDPRFGEVDASVAALLRFPSGGLAQFIASFGASTVDNYRVVGTSGDIELDPSFRFETATKLRLRRDGEVGETQFPHIDQFAAQVQYFSDCIKAGTPPEADGEEGLADLRALLAIETAVLTGQPQTITSRPRARHPTPDMVRFVSATDRRLVL